jgi:hypothetical protein
VPRPVAEILAGNEFNRIIGVLLPASIEQRAERCFVGDMFKPQDYLSTKVSAAVTAAQD